MSPLICVLCVVLFGLRLAIAELVSDWYDTSTSSVLFLRGAVMRIWYLFCCVMCDKLCVYNRLRVTGTSVPVSLNSGMVLFCWHVYQ